MSPASVDPAGADRPIWLIGNVSAGFSAAIPTEGGSSFENEMAASNRAAVAYSQQLLQQLIGGFGVPASGTLIECGSSPAPQSVGPAAIERLLLHVPTKLREPGRRDSRTARFSSAAELVSNLDAGAVVSTAAFGEQIPFARRLREHLDRVTRRTSTLELLVLGQDSTASIESGADLGGLVLVDGAVDLESPLTPDFGPGPLALGAAVAWNGIGTFSLRGQQRWSTVIIIGLSADDASTAAAAAACAPISSNSIVSILAEQRFRTAGVSGRADLFVRAIAPGGLVIPESIPAEGGLFAIGGKHYGVTKDAARAVAMVHAGPALSLAALDRVLGSAAADEFCAVATVGGWLEYCHKGDLLT